MDRSILEGDPHSVIEAMTIAGYAIGANQGYIYSGRVPYRCQAIEYRHQSGEGIRSLGKNIFNSGFNLIWISV